MRLRRLFVERWSTQHDGIQRPMQGSEPVVQQDWIGFAPSGLETGFGASPSGQDLPLEVVFLPVLQGFWLRIERSFEYRRTSAPAHSDPIHRPPRSKQDGF